jgi:hypothetical protein
LNNVLSIFLDVFIVSIIPQVCFVVVVGLM